MQYILIERLKKAATKIHFCWGQWPDFDTITQSIISLPEYKAACDLFVVDLGREVVALVFDCVERVKHEWVEIALHKCLSLDEFVVPPLYGDVIVQYYEQLQANILCTLLSSAHVYDDEQLELMIPFIKSPFFNRERIKSEYYNQCIRSQRPE